MVATMLAAPGVSSAAEVKPQAVHVAARVSACAPFTDVRASNQFCAHLQWLATHGVITDRGKYHPTSSITRGTMAAFLYRMTHPGASAPRCKTRPFYDVSTSNKYCGYIKWAVNNGVTYGYSDNGYHPKSPVTRQAMAAFFHRVVFPHQGGKTCRSAPYWDVPTTSQFCGVITWMRGSGITYGYSDNGYHPGSPVTRQAMAAFVKRTIDKQLGGGMSAALTAAGSPGFEAYRESQIVLDAINRQRKAHGRSALVMDPLLTKACLIHNKAMARANKLSHQLPGEKQFMARDIAAGASHYKYYGENVGRAGFGSNFAGRAIAMNTIMYNEKPPGETGHRENILSRNFSHIGISTYVDPHTHNVWLCQDFGGGHFG